MKRLFLLLACLPVFPVYSMVNEDEGQSANSTLLKTLLNSGLVFTAVGNELNCVSSDGKLLGSVKFFVGYPDASEVPVSPFLFVNRLVDATIHSMLLEGYKKNNFEVPERHHIRVPVSEIGEVFKDPPIQEQIDKKVFKPREE